MRMQLLASSLVLAIGAAIAPIASHAAVGIVVGVAPPAPRVEIVPAARVGYVWTPGYWRWNGVAPHWSAYGSRWHYTAGYWAR